MRCLLVVTFCLNACLSLLAQDKPAVNSRLDSLTAAFKVDSAHTYRFKKFRPYFSIDNRNSFIKDAPVNFRGLQLGLIFKERHIMGLGVYKITQKSARPVKTRDNTNRIVNQYLNLNYLTFFYEYTLLDRRYFEIDIPIEIGLGRANIRLVDSLTQITVRNENIGIIPLGTGLQLVLKPFKWVGISAMGGYRYVNEKGRNLNLNGSYYSIGVWVDIRQIYRDIKFYGFQRKKYRREYAKIKNQNTTL